MKKICYIIFSFYFLFYCSVNIFADEKKEKTSSKTITINSAQYTEYKKIPSAPYTKEELELKKIADEKLEKDELIIFTGLVSISVLDGNSKSTIKADKIIHNKTRETLTAIGNVFYERKIGSADGESFTGAYLIFNIKKLEGVFLDGIIEQAPTKKGREPFRIHTGTAGRNESGTIAFNKALLTTSKDDDPLWSIRASRIWLLPGNEMAFANGFLSVGVVPILYFPFFYYPGDEMIVHPVFGYRNREGAFVQTTTYLFGRKPAPTTKEGTSFSNFMQSDSLKKQKREGLFFKKLDEPASGIGGSYLKLIADSYSGLGYIIGLDGKFVIKNDFIKKINFYSYFGFSNTLYKDNTKTSKIEKYSVYNKKGKIRNDKSNFFGKKVPFRYNFNFDMQVSKTPFNVSIAFPFISDPYFKKDFMGRSEDMNWFKYWLDKDKLAKLSGSGTDSSYAWKIDGSIRPTFPKIRPWINSISFDKISTNLNFESKQNSELKNEDATYAPERQFFYPKNFAPEFKMTLSGTLFSTSMLNKGKKLAKKKDLQGLKNPFDDKFLDGIQNTSEKNNSDNEASDEKQADDISDEDAVGNSEKKDLKNELDSFAFELIPLYKIKPANTYNWTNFIDYNLNYKFSGTALKDLVFEHKNWVKPDDIKWKKIYSDFYKLNGVISLDSKFSFNKGFLNILNSFQLKGNYQKHSKIEDDTEKAKLGLSNFKLSVYTLTNNNSIKINPLIFMPMFKPSYAEWKMSENLIENKFVGSYEKPEWKIEKVKWKKKYIKTHSLGAGFGVVLYDYTQLFTTTANLPPLLQSYSCSGDFSFPYTTLFFSLKRFQKEKSKSTSTSSSTSGEEDENTEKEWVWAPFDAGLNFSFPYDIKLNQSYTYNIEDKKNEKYTLSLGWKSFSLAYNMSRQISQKLEAAKGWVPKSSKKKFIPQSLVINASNSAFPVEIYSWKNRIKFSWTFSSTTNFNLIRITDSYFSFSNSISFKIHEFWDITFSSTSRNDSIARYFQKSLNLPIEIPGERNILKDLAQSFYFWDEDARRKSGFKLKSLNFSLTHYLKDWLMKFTYSVKPVLRDKSARKYYELAPTITFMVQWNPIGDIKVQTKKEDKKFKVDRGEIK